jgi:hypothetical protein
MLHLAETGKSGYFFNLLSEAKIVPWQKEPLSDDLLTV